MGMLHGKADGQVALAGQTVLAKKKGNGLPLSLLEPEHG
jgi:hypothetical protein